MSCKNFENHKCADCNNNKVIVAKENRCKFVLNNINKEKICKIRIDGCYLLSGRKCDYLILACNSKISYLIELKGSSFWDAIDQIVESLNKLENSLNGFVINARIVLTKVNVPNIKNTPTVLSLQKRLRKLGGNLRQKSILMVENTS